MTDSSTTLRGFYNVGDKFLFKRSSKNVAGVPDHRAIVTIVDVASDGRYVVERPATDSRVRSGTIRTRVSKKTLDKDYTRCTNSMA